MKTAVVERDLPRVDSVIAVCAHPDDESFALGTVLSAFVDRGARTSVPCLLHGEAERSVRTRAICTPSESEISIRQLKWPYAINLGCRPRILVV